MKRLTIIFLQLKPVRGRYIFEKPSCSDYSEAYGDGSESLWSEFQAIQLTHNHRQQGAERLFAELLNRVRVGKQTQEDLGFLEQHVKQEGDPAILDCVRICATVKETVDQNEKKVNELPGKLYCVKATNFTSTKRNFTPMCDKSGRIGDTQFLNHLTIKIGSRVLLIFNIGRHKALSKFEYFSMFEFQDVSDGLCNGAIGTLSAVEENVDGSIRRLLVRFDNPRTGERARASCPLISKKYPGCTLISPKEIEYSLAKSNSLVSATATLVQYPLIPAFAVTGKFLYLLQGSIAIYFPFNQVIASKVRQ